jgi:hypothetical protein
MKSPFLLAAGLLCGATLILTGCSVAQSYIDKGQEVISADNVEDQYTRVIKGWNGLITSSDNACNAQKTNDPNSPTFVEDPALAYKATYRNIWVDYNARQANIFKAGFVGPPGYPKKIPNWVQGPKPDFCAISTNLLELKAAQ